VAGVITLGLLTVWPIVCLSAGAYAGWLFTTRQRALAVLVAVVTGVFVAVPPWLALLLRFYAAALGLLVGLGLGWRRRHGRRRMMERTVH